MGFFPSEPSFPNPTFDHGANSASEALGGPSPQKKGHLSEAGSWMDAWSLLSQISWGLGNKAGEGWESMSQSWKVEGLGQSVNALVGPRALLWVWGLSSIKLGQKEWLVCENVMKYLKHIVADGPY